MDRLLGSGNALGRGIYMAGDHATDGGFPVADKPARGIPRCIPFKLPCSLVNRYTLKAFNWRYYHSHASTTKQVDVDYVQYFYPLDGIRDWNRIYGRRGFQQYQCVIPEAASRDAMRAILTSVSASGTGSFLAVLKRCGALPSPGLLSFPMPGLSLALDFSQHRNGNDALFSRLDAIVRDAGGRQYPAKDAHMSGADFRAAYPVMA